MKKQLILLGAAAILAVLGVAALVNYAQSADDRAFEGTERVTVLRATEEIAAATPIEKISGLIETVELPKAAVVDNAIESLDQVDGLVTKYTLAAGDQLATDRFAEAKAAKSDTDPKKGEQELTIPISVERMVGGSVKAGDVIGIFTSYATGKVTANPLNKIRVLKVIGADDAAAKELQITLAVQTRQAEQIVHAIEFGTVWLTKQNADTDTGGGKTIEQKDVAK